LENFGIELPDNAFLLKADAKITFKDLVDRFRIYGITVHTTTVGFEYPAQGMPVITTANSPYRGFGFTIDPETKSDYFEALAQLLGNSRMSVDNSLVLLAKSLLNFINFIIILRLVYLKVIPRGYPRAMSSNCRMIILRGG